MSGHDGSDPVQDLLDRAGVAEALHRYTDAVDAKDWDAFPGAFTPDAVIDYTASYGIRGSVAEITEWISKLMTDEFVPKTMHALANIRIDLDGDAATAKAYYINPDVMSDGAGGYGLLLNAGTYTASLRREDGEWRIASLAAEIMFSHRGELEQFEIPADA